LSKTQIDLYRSMSAARPLCATIDIHQGQELAGGPTIVSPVKPSAFDLTLQPD
jgi:hypothetical protein